MKEKPIIFSGPMVRAILDGRKTMTRRAIKGRDVVYQYGSVMHRVRRADGDHMEGMACPYGQPGDHLWVRETWTESIGGQPGTPDDGTRIAYYKADGMHGEKFRGWKPSIYMPRWASRITLEVTGVRVERVQDISEEDAWNEGIEPVWDDGDPSCYALGAWKNYEFETAHPRKGTKLVREKHELMGYQDPVRSFKSLWDSINAARGYGWDANPWVWVVEFRGVEE